MFDRIEWFGRGKRMVKVFAGRGAWIKENHIADLREELSRIPD